MARLTKKELKGILKECLREILKEEGILLAEAGTTNQQSRPAAKEGVTPSNQPVTNTRLMETVSTLSGRFAGKGKKETTLMQRIFSDTAATTLQEQQASGHSVGAGAGGMPTDVGDISMPSTPQRQAQDTNDLQSLSHQGDVGRWAQVAFAGDKG